MRELYLSALHSKHHQTISLAKKDTLVIKNLARAEVRSYTEKQKELACILLTKYKRQLKVKAKVDVPDPHSLPLRYPTRVLAEINEELRISSLSNYLELKFRFENSLTPILLKLSKKLYGNVFYNSKSNVWYIYDSPYNIKEVIDLVRKYKNITITSEVLKLYERVMSEDRNYGDPLVVLDDKTITRASPALMIAINKNTEGMGVDEKLIYLTDRRKLYGYRIGAGVRNAVDKILSKESEVINRLLNSSTIDYKVDQFSKVNPILRYCYLANRNVMFINTAQVMPTFNNGRARGITSNKLANIISKELKGTGFDAVTIIKDPQEISNNSNQLNIVTIPPQTSMQTVYREWLRVTDRIICISNRLGIDPTYKEYESLKIMGVGYEKGIRMTWLGTEIENHFNY